MVVRAQAGLRFVSMAMLIAVAGSAGCLDRERGPEAGPHDSSSSQGGLSALSEAAYVSAGDGQPDLTLVITTVLPGRAPRAREIGLRTVVHADGGELLDGGGMYEGACYWSGRKWSGRSGYSLLFPITGGCAELGLDESWTDESGRHKASQSVPVQVGVPARGDLGEGVTYSVTWLTPAAAGTRVNE